MKTPIIQITDFKGGISLNDKFGRKDGFQKGNKADFGSKPGYIAPGYAWKKVQFGGADDMPTRFTKILHLTNGDIYFGGEDAKIYKNSGLNEIVLVRTSSQVGIVRDLAEYKDYLIYTQNATIGRYGPLSGTPSWTDNWQTGKATVSYHPILVSADDEVYIGNKNKLDRWDGTTYSAAVMEIGDDGWQIRCLEDFGEQFIAIGAAYQKTANQFLKAKIFLWDREIERWNDEISIPERDIKAMKLVSGYLWIWAGRSCNLYVVPLNSRVATKMFSFVKEEPYGELEVYPGSIEGRGGIVYFGFSLVGASSKDKNPCGIYSFPANPENFTLNLPFTTYFDGLGYKERFKSLGIFRGATDVSGDILFASYWDTENNKQYLYREMLAVADNSPYKDEAIIQSFCYDVPEDRLFYIKDAIIKMLSLPVGCNLSLYYKKDYEDFQPIIENFSTTGTIEKKINKIIKGNQIQLKLVLRGSLTGLARPFIKSITLRGGIIIKP